MSSCFCSSDSLPHAAGGGSEQVTGWGPGSTHHENTEEGDKTKAPRWHFCISWWKKANPKAGKGRWQLALKAGPLLWVASKVTSTTFFSDCIETEMRLVFSYETGFRNFVIFHFRSPRNISIFCKAYPELLMQYTFGNVLNGFFNTVKNLSVVRFFFSKLKKEAGS